MSVGNSEQLFVTRDFGINQLEQTRVHVGLASGYDKGIAYIIFRDSLCQIFVRQLLEFSDAVLLTVLLGKGRLWRVCFDGIHDATPAIEFIGAQAFRVANSQCQFVCNHL